MIFHILSQYSQPTTLNARSEGNATFFKMVESPLVGSNEGAVPIVALKDEVA